MKKSVLKYIITESVFDEAVSKHGTLIGNPLEVAVDGYVITFLNDTVTIVVSQDSDEFKETYMWNWVGLSYTQLIDRLSKKTI